MELSVESTTFCCIFADTIFVLKDLNNVILLVKIFVSMFTCVQLDILKYGEFYELAVSKNVPNNFYFLKAYNTLHFLNLLIIMTWYKC